MYLVTYIRNGNHHYMFESTSDMMRSSLEVILDDIADDGTAVRMWGWFEGDDVVDRYIFHVDHWRDHHDAAGHPHFHDWSDSDISWEDFLAPHGFEAIVFEGPDDDLGKMCGDLWSSCGPLVARKVEGDKASFNPVSEMVSWWGIDSPQTKDDPARMEMIADVIKAIL